MRKVREVKNEKSDLKPKLPKYCCFPGGSLGVSHEIRSLIEVYLGSLYVP
jgi:hypothetical protein